MADIRIKDLTTTASSTASDDFIAVDGATNGTRKLNAYSPSFGGNATVAGTINVGSKIAFAAQAAGTTLVDLQSTDDAAILGLGGVTKITFGGNLALTASNVGRAFAGATEILRWGSGVVNVYPTTASTTTSSGALVVSGGVGVAGAMNVGGVITTDAEYLQGSNVNFNIRSTATNGNVYLKSNGGTLYLNNTAGNGDIRLGNTGNVVTVVGTTASTSTSTGALVVSGGLGVGGSLNAGAVFAANSITGGDTGFGTSIIQFKDGSGSTKINFKGNGEVTLSATTASTSTSTGALVVNGGVGVGGAANIGGTLTVSNPVVAQGTAITGYQFLAKDTGGTAVGAAYALQTSGGTDKWRWGLRGSAGALTDSLIFSALDGSWLDALTISNSGNATLGGSIRTSAPAGGTAAAWKLGTVASVSPTSPNRTIEVDIGGTIYYIHAKTTNN